GRWAIDAERLRRARAQGMEFVVIVETWLGGGTKRAIDDIGSLVGYRGRVEMRLRSLRSGAIQLSCPALPLSAVFGDDDVWPLLAMLNAAEVSLVMVHQLLGFSKTTIDALTTWCRPRNSIAYIHDFYSICPRVTLIDAVGTYCGIKSADVCDRCVGLGGGHEASRLNELSVGEHRTLLGDFLGAMRTVVAPSDDAARHVASVYPGLAIRAIPHPELRDDIDQPGDRSNMSNIILLGGIGPHKGSEKLLEIARLARLTHPHLTFSVIGHTDIDDALEAVGNVRISGQYKKSELRTLLDQERGRIALFLHIWPETYSYTLSEALNAGLLPLVPDIGAPAERIRLHSQGLVFDFPIQAANVLRIIDSAVESREVERPDPLTRHQQSSIRTLDALVNSSSQLSASARLEDSLDTSR
ncbi:hypothetical protein IMSHALPRED_005075, partial [Imshaugia aleurites]